MELFAKQIWQPWCGVVRVDQATLIGRTVTKGCGLGGKLIFSKRNVINLISLGDTRSFIRGEFKDKVQLAIKIKGWKVSISVFL
jgi:hypothetical protein